MEMQPTVLLSQYLGGDESNIIAFKEGGDALVDFVIKDKKYSWYEVFLRPIGFLYRHYLELELKYWIKRLSANKLLNSHNLKNLWLELKPLIQPFCTSQGCKKSLNEVEEVVLTFDKYDPTGQEFRYTRTAKDMGTLRNIPPTIDVKSVKCSIMRVSDFFDGLSEVVES